MRKNLGFALVLLLSIVSNGGTMAQTQAPEQKIWNLLDDSKAAYVSLGEAEFRGLGAGFDLPDGGRSITRLADQAPGGAFDPRDVAKLAPNSWATKPTGLSNAFAATTSTGTLPASAWRASIRKRKATRGSSS